MQRSEDKAGGAIPESPGAAAQVEAAQAEAESQGADLAEVTPAPPAEPTPVNQVCAYPMHGAIPSYCSSFASWNHTRQA